MILRFDPETRLIDVEPIYGYKPLAAFREAALCWEEYAQKNHLDPCAPISLLSVTRSCQSCEQFVFRFEVKR